MSASSSDERDAWIRCLTESIREHPFHDIIAAKKKKAAMRRKQQEQEGNTPRKVNLPVVWWV